MDAQLGIGGSFRAGVDANPNHRSSPPPAHQVGRPSPISLNSEAANKAANLLMLLSLDIDGHVRGSFCTMNKPIATQKNLGNSRGNCMM